MVAIVDDNGRRQRLNITEDGGDVWDYGGGE